MSRLLAALRPGRVLLMDGAMGTELMRRGARPGAECLEAWNLTRPDEVAAVHAAYRAAGAECLLTNTFQAGPAALARHGVAARLAEVWHAALRLARARPGAPLVLADVGPLAAADADPVLAACRGADGLLLETWSDLDALPRLAERNRAQPGPPLPLLVSFTFRRSDPGAVPRTFGGATPEECARAAAACGADVLGVNCGAALGPDDLVAVLERYRAVTDQPLLVRPNAGTPVSAADGPHYPLTPAALAAALPRLLRAGATLVGGCCGTTPAHVAACRAVLKEAGAA